MVTIEYNSVKISVPQTWDDVKLGHYETFYNERPANNRQRVALVAKICQVDPDVLLAWPAEVFNHIVRVTNFLFIDSPATPVPFTEIDGTRYIVPIEEKLTLGAWVDADEVQKSGEAVLSNVLAIICRPAGEAYDFNNNEARAALFADQPVSKFLGVLAFFLQCKNGYEQLTETYLRLAQLADLLRQTTKVSLKRGAGIKLYRIWPIIKFYVSTRLLHYQLQKFSPSYGIAKIKTAPKKYNAN